MIKRMRFDSREGQQIFLLLHRVKTGSEAHLTPDQRALTPLSAGQKAVVGA
jgi:hypothetical protein